MRHLAAVALSLSSTVALAQRAAPGDRVYELHSEAQGTCPALDWHIVVSPDGVLSGTFAYPDRKMIAEVAGSILPHVQVERSGPSLGGDPNTQQFRMIATELGRHKKRMAEITGIIQRDGWMVAAVKGEGVSCKGIKVPLFAPPPGARPG